MYIAYNVPARQPVSPSVRPVTQFGFKQSEIDGAETVLKWFGIEPLSGTQGKVYSSGELNNIVKNRVAIGWPGNVNASPSKAPLIENLSKLISYKGPQAHAIKSAYVIGPLNKGDDPNNLSMVLLTKPNETYPM